MYMTIIIIGYKMRHKGYLDLELLKLCNLSIGIALNIFLLFSFLFILCWAHYIFCVDYPKYACQ